MSRTPVITTLAVAALLAFPVSAATWYSYGFYEPDTTLDVPQFMRQDGPGTSTNLVYFNVFYSSGELGGANGAWVNPNVGAVQTNLEPPGTTYFEAMLGVWTDCNGDGYVGMLETAIREYDAKLLLSDDLCPAINGPKTSWIAGAHNYNGWVTEYIPIGSNETRNADSRIYKDVEAMVWGDPGKPDDAQGAPGIFCQGAARGTYQTTGGILYQLDCQGQGTAVAATVGGQPVDTGQRVKIIDTINQVDGATGLGIGLYGDPSQSDSPLNQPTFGSDDSSNSAVYVQDCNAEPVVGTGPDYGPIPDLPGDDSDNVVLVREPSAGVNSDVSSWTVPGTLNYTAETVYAPEGTFGADSTGNCNFEDDPGQDFYGFFEGTVDVPPSGGKDAAWTQFRFNTATRGSLPANAYPQNGAPLGGSGNSGVPTDFGIEALGIMCTASSCMQSNWLGAFVRYNTRTVTLRYDLAAIAEDPFGNVPTADLASAPYYSFYAHVGGATKDRGLGLTGGVGAYGAAQCGDASSGLHNGWNCDAAAWYRRSDGTYPNVPFPLARVGQQYEARDVDCFDGSIGSTGVGLAVTYYGPAPCQRPG